MQWIGNLFRIFFAACWTAIVGAILNPVIHASYQWGKILAGLGKPEVLDRILNWNANWAGMITQKFWVPFLLKLAGVKLKVTGLRQINWSQPHVICSNHTSLLDVLVLIRAIPIPFRFVAKKELLKWWFVGWALRPAGQIIVDRADHQAALEALDHAGGKVPQGQVIFFVEGTRSKTGYLHELKKGAFHFALQNRLPILPVSISGSFRILSKAPWWKLRPGGLIKVAFSEIIAVEWPLLATLEEKKQYLEDLIRRTQEAILRQMDWTLQRGETYEP